MKNPRAKYFGVLIFFVAVGALFPAVALANPTVTANGAAILPLASVGSALRATSTTITNPWNVQLTFDQEISNIPVVKDGTPNYSPDGFISDPFGNGTVQSLTDCGDGDLRTFCFTYAPPAGQPDALFWYFRISGAQDTSLEYVATTSTHRFIIDTEAPTLTLAALPNQVFLPTISGQAFTQGQPAGDLASVAIAITSTALAVPRAYQATVSGNDWSYTLLAGDELPEGFFTVTVQSTDLLGNQGVAASGTMTIDNSPPVITITSGPANGGYATSSPVVFGFSSVDVSSTTFTCSWDGGPPAACSSPASQALSDGAHTFAVRGEDAYGNNASTSRSFTLDTSVPILLEDTPIATTTDTTPDYTFSSTEAGSLVVGGSCSSVTTTTGVGTSTITLSAAVGAHSDCTLSVSDVAGNSATLFISPFLIEAPAVPATVSTGGGGGNGVQGGPLAVGYQTPSASPAASIPTPPAGTPEPQPLVLGNATESRPTLAAARAGTPSSDAPADTRTEEAPVPSLFDTSSPLAAAAVSSGIAPTWFTDPQWQLLLGGLIILLCLGGGWFLFFSKKP